MCFQIGPILIPAITSYILLILTSHSLKSRLTLYPATGGAKRGFTSKISSAAAPFNERRAKA